MTTRTKETEAAYKKKVIDCMIHVFNVIKNDEEKEKYIEKRKINNEIISTTNIVYTVAWYSKNKAFNYSPATWRFLRASFIYFSSKELNKNRISENDFNKIKNILYQTKSGNKKIIPKRTSAKKSKYLKSEDLKKIKEELSKKNHKWKIATLIWIQAGVLTGLRPIEWTQTEYINEKNNEVYLKVKNAKNTNERAHSEFRTIYLNHLTESQLKIVKNQLKIAQQFYEKNMWKIYYNGCSNLLRNINKKLWPKREKNPTLYTARHQFSANIKASGYSTTEVATLMGHASDQTAQEHYGKKRYGNKVRTPKINRKEELKVREKKKNIFSFDNLEN